MTGLMGPIGIHGTQGHTGAVGSQGVTGVQGAAGAVGPVGPTPASGAPYYSAIGPMGMSGWIMDPKIIHGPQDVSNNELEHEFILDRSGTVQPHRQAAWEAWQCANCGMRIESPRGANFQEILKIATRCSESAVQEVIDL